MATGKDNTKRKLKTIALVLLSLLVFAISDITGKLFHPADIDVPGTVRMVLWGAALVTCAIPIYLKPLVRKPAILKILFTAYIILWVIAVWFSGAVSYIRTDLGGYVACGLVLPFISWLLYIFIPWSLRKAISLIKRSIKAPGARVGALLALILLITVALIYMIAAGYKNAGRFVGVNETISIPTFEENNNKDHREPYRDYSKIFNDLQETQLKSAIANGVKGIKDINDAQSNPKLAEIKTCKQYKVDELTHSIPYLVPKAKRLVEDIGKAFQDSLYNRGYSRDHRIIVTSVFRTESNVKSLRKSNSNATENSCHSYGTTVDIAYYRFDVPESGRVADQEKMRQVLFQVVNDLRNQKRCWVKYEKNQSCLHMTVR